ncbi:MAG: DUF459 domain-containing protein [Candidatus Tokpelaia sp.]|uniref:SGNH/GDSL hydrolase family protein n=1 Tax=Candidatus Tokpelaia sp. TaxID=2233777 RepID=UPI0012390073|nr:SGNH family hydrolase [Candidatus Tokpelaia sp.]KAA6204924.1 MAG: DUF459 domain-containing protein [Candidatus Tokpelaia sp.]KAA6207097.1 MAG: DUF459 domain-containing protein [Candidatus Tokpelaia sp.]KAA6405365.1 DUF459 domain-containing protein [Candidatus Tokpelaia sp.]
MSQIYKRQRKQHKKPGSSKLWAALFFVLPLAAFFAFGPLLSSNIGPAEAQFWHRERNSAAEGQGRSKNSTAALRQRSGREPGEPHRSFWDRLFGRHPKPQPERQQPVQTAPLVPKINSIAKSPNARRVLVIGDFTAAALAEGLNRAYSDNADILVRSKTENNSGLNRIEVYNWPAAISTVIAREKPDLIIVMLGANDRQPLKPADNQAGKQADFDTEEWTKAYIARIQSLVQALQKSGAMWLWVGLPAFKQENLNEAALSFNRLYKQAVEQAGGHFVDIWEGFVDAQGAFALSGYDEKGQTARLRTNDGINFTAAGRRKLAFYAEQAIELLWGGTLKQPQSAEPANSGKVLNGRVAPVNPMDIGAAGKPFLVGGAAVSPLPAAGTAATAPAKPENSAAIEQNQSRRGRADDFNLPQAQPAAP